jgi:hypothetical protein
MMKIRLTEADKQWLLIEIKEAVKQAVNEALTAEIQWEKVRDEETGVPLKHREHRSEEVFLPAFFCQMLPFYEQAIRGLQEDCGKANNRSLETAAKVDALGQTLISMEESVKTMARFTLALKRTGLLRQLQAMAQIEAVTDGSGRLLPEGFVRDLEPDEGDS